MSSMTLAMLLTLKDLASGPLGEFHGKLQKTSQNLMAIGTTAMQAGDKMIGALKAPVAAFAEAEDAATALRIAMMDQNGVSKGFEQVNKLATNLGNKLPGTTADFQNMMRVLKEQGVGTDAILSGVGKSAAYLAVQLKLPFDQAAKFAAKVAEATGVASKDMEKFMDVIQRTANLGVEAGEMQYAFGRSAGKLKEVKMQGLESASAMSVLYAQLIKTGLSGETVGTNFAAVLTNLQDYQYNLTDKASSARESVRRLGLELNFFNKDGSFKGPREMVAQLEKLAKLKPEVKASILKDMFGGGQDGQMIASLINGGVAAYDAMQQRMKDQADLNTKVEEQLQTLLNIWDAATGTFTNLLATLGGAIAPELKMLSDMFGRFSEKAIAFAEAHPTITKIAVALTALTGVGLLLGGGLIFGLGVMLNMVATIGGALPVAVGFLSTKFLSLYSTFLKIGAWNTLAGARLTAWVTGLPGKIGGAFSRLGAWFVGFPARFAAMFAKMRLGVGAFGGRIISAFGSIGRAFIGFPGAIVRFFTGLPGLIMRIPSLLSLVAGSFKALALASLSNPLGWIIGAIVVGAVLIYKYWKPIKGFFSGLWQGLKVGLGQLKPAFQDVFIALAPLLKPVLGALKTLWGWIKNLIKPVDDTGNSAQKMGVRFGLAIARIIGEAAKILVAFLKLPGQLFSIGSNMMTSLISGIKSIPIVKAATDYVGGMINSIKRLAGINSPSRVFTYFGQMMGSGLQLGMESTTGILNKAAGKMAKAATPELPKLATIKASGSALPEIATANASLTGSPGLGSSSGMQITFAPNISLSTGSPAAQQVQEVMPLLYDEFKRMMRQYEHDRNRSFA